MNVGDIDGVAARGGDGDKAAEEIIEELRQRYDDDDGGDDDDDDAVDVDDDGSRPTKIKSRTLRLKKRRNSISGEFLLNKETNE